MLAAGCRPDTRGTKLSQQKHNFAHGDWFEGTKQSPSRLGGGGEQLRPEAIKYPKTGSGNSVEGEKHSREILKGGLVYRSCYAPHEID